MRRRLDNNAPQARIAIGIQARSTSRRFPNKVSEAISGKSIAIRVIDAAVNAANYTNNKNKNSYTSVSLLIPKNDPISNLTKSYVEVLEGPGTEDDVLSRYVALQHLKQADYVVRITADCPIIPPFIISKMITLAIKGTYDYISNVDERFRTAPDGFDCEVMSKRSLEYLNEVAKGPTDREHVTTLLRKSRPNWMIEGFQINALDLSHLKLSVDTIDDLERVREEYYKADRKLQGALAFFGKTHVHMF